MVGGSCKERTYPECGSIASPRKTLMHSFSGSAYNVNCALKTLRRMLHLAQEWGLIGRSRRSNSQRRLDAAFCSIKRQNAILPLCGPLLRGNHHPAP